MLVFSSKVYDEEKQIFFLKKSINDMKEHLKKIKQDTKSKNAYRLQKTFYAKMNQILRGLLDNSNIRVSLSKIDCLEYLIKNISELNKIYNSIIEEERQKGRKICDDDIGYFSTNIEQNKISNVKECLILLRERLDKINNFSDKTKMQMLCRKSKKERDKLLDTLERKFGKEVRKDMEERIKIFRTPEFDLLKDTMTEVLNAYSSLIKEQYKSSLTFIGKFLQEFDLIKNYVNSNNNNLSRIGLEELNCNEEQIKKMFTKEFLDNLTVDQLTYLNVYWINRFTKEMDNICKSGFVLTDLNLWQDVFDGKDIKLTNEELKWELLKMDTLSNFTIDCLDESKDNKVLRDAIEKARNQEGAENQIKEKGTLRLDFSDYIKQTEAQYGEEYKKRYSAKLPRSKNFFQHEIEYFKSAYNSIQNAYKLKDIALLGILDNLQLNGNIENWGVMEQAHQNKILNAKYILIGVDKKNMNITIRIHIPQDLLIDWANENIKEKVLPLYAGGDDYRSNEFWLTSPILKPVDEEEKKILKQKIEDKKKEEFNNLYHHLGYVYGIEEFPIHLQTEVIQPGRKGKKIKKIKFIRNYIKMDTEEIIDEIQLKELQKQNKGDGER